MNRLPRIESGSVPVAGTVFLLVLPIFLLACVSPADPARVVPADEPSAVPERERALPEEREDPETDAPGDAAPEPPAAPERVRTLPEPAGTRPRSGDIPVLTRYVRDLPPGEIILELAHAPPFSAAMDQLARQYLSGVSLRGVDLRLVPFGGANGASQYGRMDIVVSPVQPFRGLVPPRTVRGPTVFSGVSTLDAELASLYRFPREALQRATDRVRFEMDRLARRRGIPYSLEIFPDGGGNDGELLEAVLHSLGSPGETPDRWWLFLPPHEAELYLREHLEEAGYAVRSDGTGGVMILGQAKEDEQ